MPDLEARAHPNHRFVRLRVLDYRGSMKLSGYCNGEGGEFLSITLDDANLPDTAYSTDRLSRYVKDKVDNRIADPFVGNELIHGMGSEMEVEINRGIQTWWNDIKSRFSHLHYKDYAVYPAQAKPGHNHFDISIINCSPRCLCTLSIEFAPPSGEVFGMITVQMDAERWQFAPELEFS